MASPSAAAPLSPRPLLSPRLQQEEEKAREQLSGKMPGLKFKGKADRRRAGSQQEEEFRPVPGTV